MIIPIKLKTVTISCTFIQNLIKTSKFNLFSNIDELDPIITAFQNLILITFNYYFTFQLILNVMGLMKHQFSNSGLKTPSRSFKSPC